MTTRGRPPKFPFRKLNVGESFLIPGRTRQSVKGCAAHMKDRRFSFRTIMVNGCVSVRVWRVA